MEMQFLNVSVLGLCLSLGIRNLFATGFTAEEQLTITSYLYNQFIITTRPVTIPSKCTDFNYFWHRPSPTE